MSVESVLARVGVLEQAISNPASLLAANVAAMGGTPATAQAPTTAGASFAQALQSASASQAGTAGASGAEALTSAPNTIGAETMTNALSPMGAGTVTSALSPASAGMPTSALNPMDTGTMTGALSPASTGTATSALNPIDAELGTSAGGAGAQIVRIAESQLGQTEQPPGSNESPAIAMYRTATAGAAPGAPWCAYFASWAARLAGAPIGANGEGLGSVGQIWSWAQSSGRAIPNGPGVTPQPGDLIVFGDEHVGIVRDVLPNGDIQTIEGNYENKVSANVRTPTEATGYVNMN
jgi:hypothetical protein